MSCSSGMLKESKSPAFLTPSGLTHWLKTIPSTTVEGDRENTGAKSKSSSDHAACTICSTEAQIVTHSDRIEQPDPDAAGEQLQVFHDTVIVGAGITGCALAYYLSTFGMTCLVLDARNVAHGGTGRNGGIIWPNELDRFQLHSVALLREFVDSNNIECDFRPCGGVYLEGEPGNETDADEKICIFPADDDVSQDNDYEVRYEKVDPVELLHASDNGFARAYFEPAVASVHAAKLARGYAQCAVATGCTKIIPNCLVRDISVDSAVAPSYRGSASSNENADEGDVVTYVNTSLGQFRCRRVVVATNGWIPRLLPELKKHMDPCVGTVLASQTPVPEVLRWPVSCISFGEAEHELYGSMTADGFLILGGLRDSDAGWCDGDDDTKVDEQNIQLLKTWFAKFFPKLAKEVEFGMAWNGTMGDPVDGKPMFGVVPGRSDRVLVCGGYSGEGMTRSVGMAHGMAELLAGTTVTQANLLLDSYNVARFWKSGSKGAPQNSD